MLQVKNKQVKLFQTHRHYCIWQKQLFIDYEKHMNIKSLTAE